jgi:hypothetical protein
VAAVIDVMLKWIHAGCGDVRVGPKVEIGVKRKIIRLRDYIRSSPFAPRGCHQATNSVKDAENPSAPYQNPSHVNLKHRVRREPTAAISKGRRLADIRPPPVQSSLPGLIWWQ